MQKREFDETNAVHTWRRGAGGRRGIRLPRGKGPLLKVDDAAAQGVGVRFHLRKLIDSSSISMSVSTPTMLIATDCSHWAQHKTTLGR